ncbi:protein FAM110C-like [Huso huso]|uniref:Protein FAM110C-like n=1 Tax=Huso huso TaxID=61971 RepID=A0ABR0ZVX2_HUSHU
MEDISSTLPTRLLNKGPDYLRKQMELETRGKLSAVERLAADKAKYVKSQQVINSKQEPAITLSSASESGSNGSGSFHSGARCINNNNNAENEDLHNANNASETLPASSPIVRRSSSKKQRRDSLMMYRQKCDKNVKGSSNDNSKGSLVRRLFQSSLKEKCVNSPKVQSVQKDTENKCKVPENKSQLEIEANTRINTQATCVDNHKPPLSAIARVKDTSRTGLFRSHSDISSRYSKSFADFDFFFKYCGLDTDEIETIGRENFSAVSERVSLKIRSVSVATSEDGFSRHSGDSDRLLEEELNEKRDPTTGSSVIERNARIIKWLYSCKNAKESGKVLRELE